MQTEAEQSTQPSVSVVMPSYRRGPKIAPALDSVRHQTRRPTEIIVVNDGGYEATSTFLADHYPDVTVLNVSHRGAALARNAGAEAAQGDVIVFFDDDDTMRPHAVETLLGLLKKFPEARAAHTDHTFTNSITGDHHTNHHYEFANFARLRQVRPMKHDGPDRLYDRRLFQVLLWGNLLQQPWAIYREAFLDVGGFYPGLGASDDWDLYLRTSRAFPIAVSDTVCSDHFLEKDKPTHLTLLGGQAEVQIQVLERVRQATPWHEVYTRYVVSHRLGLIHKWAGDLISKDDLAGALRHYMSAIANWPFDLLLLTRGLVAWPAKLILARVRPQGRE